MADVSRSRLSRRATLSCVSSRFFRALPVSPPCGVLLESRCTGCFPFRSIPSWRTVHDSLAQADDRSPRTPRILAEDREALRGLRGPFCPALRQEPAAARRERSADLPLALDADGEG